MNSVLPIIRIGGLLCVACAVGCSKDPAATQVAMERVADWSLTDNDAAALSEPFAIGQFEIRSPKHFRTIEKQLDPRMHSWVGPVRSDKTYAELLLIVTEFTERDLQQFGSPEKQFKDVLRGIMQRRNEFSHERIEHGQINGHPFLRTFWRGKATSEAHEALAGRLMYGVVYFGQFEKTFVQILCQDVAPNQVEAFKFGQLAAASFRIRQLKADGR